MKIWKKLFGLSPSTTPSQPTTTTPEAPVQTKRSIHEAAKVDDVGTVVGLLKEHPDLVLSKDEQGWTPLHWTAERGHGLLMGFLLVNGADVNASDDSGHTPLHQAAGGYVARALLARNADVNARDLCVARIESVTRDDCFAPGISLR